MAISPNHLNENFMNEVDGFERRIDTILASKRIAPGGYVSVDCPTGMSHQHFAILKERYIKAGWFEVTMNSDQREGTWLTFKTK
jgi:hypothetical protein